MNPENLATDAGEPDGSLLWPVPGWGVLDIVFVYLGVMGIISAFEIWGQDFYGWIGPLIAGGSYQLGHFYSSAILQYLLTLLLVGIGVRRAGPGAWKELGLRLPGCRNLLLYGVLGGLVLLGTVAAGSLLLAWINPAIEPQVYASMLEEVGSPQELAVLLIIGAVLAPLAEETYFRGMIYPVLRNKYGAGAGIAMCGLIFGASHLDLWRLLPLAAGGAILAYVYEKSSSILPCVLAHGIWNGAMTLLLYSNLL